jgi:hypothetical protein
MRSIARIVSLGASMLFVACDPGMTIRQGNEKNRSEKTAAAQVIIHVKSTRQLIGETWYAPEVRVTNTLKSPIAVTGIELAIQSKSYANASPRPETYPREIAPGSTDILNVLFRLDEDVQKTFHLPAELRIHYRNGGQQEIARTEVLGAPL